MERGNCLFPPDLLRFLGLFRYRDRRLKNHRDRLARELQHALSRHFASRILATVAHYAVQMAARLSLLFPPYETREDLGKIPQRRHNFLAKWPLARRQLDLRVLGSRPWTGLRGELLLEDPPCARRTNAQQVPRRAVLLLVGDLHF